jgi:hypothetical protein
VIYGRLSVIGGCNRLVTADSNGGRVQYGSSRAERSEGLTGLLSEASTRACGHSDPLLAHPSPVCDLYKNSYAENLMEWRQENWFGCDLGCLVVISRVASPTGASGACRDGCTGDHVRAIGGDRCALVALDIAPGPGDVGQSWRRIALAIMGREVSSEMEFSQGPNDAAPSGYLCGGGACDRHLRR